MAARKRLTIPPDVLAQIDPRKDYALGPRDRIFPDQVRFESARRLVADRHPVNVWLEQQGAL